MINGQMAGEIIVAGRRYWIVSEPVTRGWLASVLEVVGGDQKTTRDLGIQATGETRTAADNAALGQLQRRLRTPQ
jgi:hypothetical protein